MVLPLENITIGALLRRTAQQYPRNVALEYGDKEWTYAQMDRHVDTLARMLLGCGVKKGDHVGIWCEAEPNTIFMLYAVTRIGAVATMLNTSLQRRELTELLRRSDVAWLLIGDGYKEVHFPTQVFGLCGELPKLRQILYIGQSGQNYGYTILEQLHKTIAPPEALAAAEAAVSPQDTATILYTSGTTSSPKAVLSSHYSRANSGLQQAYDLHATEKDKFCVAMPVFHCFCLSVNVMAACAVGACLHLPQSRRTAALLNAIVQRRCTVFSCVPTLYHAVLCRQDFARWDLSSLRVGFIGGSMYPPAMFKEIEQKFDFTLLSSLGQTEATAGITTASFADPLELRATTVGHFMSHVEGKIAHPLTGAPLPPGQSGEICVRGYVVMQGYYGMPEATAKTVDAEGWLHTGDMGCMDEAGNIRLTGRLKDLIIRGGENISPAELENLLAGDPRVVKCKAVGVPDDHYGEEVCLCILPTAENTAAPEEFRALMAAHLAEFKVPRYVLFFDALPCTTTGKVRTEQLKQQAAARLGLLPQ